MKVSLCLEGCEGNFYLFFLRQNNVNLRTSTYIFYKSKALANMKSAAFAIFLLKSAFYGM